MKILIACEESQAVTIEFRRLGFEAYSCDILPCSGGRPEWHFRGNVFDIIDGIYKCKCGNLFENSAGKYGCCGISKLINWDLMIAFPPCTHLAVSGARHFEQKKMDGRQQEGIDFFMKIINAPIKHIAVENPIGIMSRLYKKPDQIIQPYYFGDEAQKTTCLWLKNLPKLYHQKEVDLFSNQITHVSKGEFLEFFDRKTGKKKKQPKWYADAFMFKGKDHGKERSKTFPGIAKAMAEQWGKYLLEKYESNRPS